MLVIGLVWRERTSLDSAMSSLLQLDRGFESVTEAIATHAQSYGFEGWQKEMIRRIAALPDHERSEECIVYLLDSIGSELVRESDLLGELVGDDLAARHPELVLRALDGVVELEPLSIMVFRALAHAMERTSVEGVLSYEEQRGLHTLMRALRRVASWSQREGKAELTVRALDEMDRLLEHCPSLRGAFLEVIHGIEH